MSVKSPGVFFLKIFLGCFLLTSCSQKTERTGAFAQTCFLPATQDKILTLKNGNNNAPVFNAGTVRLIREVTTPGLVQNCLSAFKKPGFTASYICNNLVGEIVDGTVYLRFYCPDQNFSVIFLDSLLHLYEAHKNAGLHKSMDQRMIEIEQELSDAKTFMELQNDSIIRFKQAFNLPASAEKMAHMLEMGTYVLDSTVLAAFFQLQITLQKSLEQCARLTQEKDDLRWQFHTSSFGLYMIELPHYVLKSE